jgi:hypothetical protein
LICFSKVDCCIIGNQIMCTEDGPLVSAPSNLNMKDVSSVKLFPLPSSVGHSSGCQFLTFRMNQTKVWLSLCRWHEESSKPSPAKVCSGNPCLSPPSAFLSLFTRHLLQSVALRPGSATHPIQWWASNQGPAYTR